MKYESDMLLGYAELEELSSGILTYNGQSAKVATFFGHLRERTMERTNMSPKIEFSIIALRSRVLTWNLQPHIEVGFVGELLNGNYRVVEIENENPVWSVIRLRESQ